MALKVFVLIVGLMLLTMFAINEAIEMMIRLYEYDNSRRRVNNGKEKQ